MRHRRLRTIREIAKPIQECLDQHFPALPEETRAAFAVQIALAHERRIAARELYEVHSPRSPN